jgi:ADP-heptose:LPS heptosyltransferase
LALTVVTLRPLGLGDLLTDVPALRAIRRAYPRARHLLAAPAPLTDLAQLTGAVDAVVDTQPLQPLPRELWGADVLVNLHGRGPQSHQVALAAAPQRLIAFAHPDVPATRGMPRWRAREHERERWCRMLTRSGIPADPLDLRLPPPPVPPPPSAVGATLIHPGAASAARRWPADRFAAVARAEQDAGRRVVITGGPDERPLARAVAASAGIPDERVLAGRTTLAELAAAVHGASRVVCGDTGVAHLATAFATPSLTLFGPVAPDEWGPPHDIRHRVLWRGRRGDPHGDTLDAGLAQISSAEALSELGRVPHDRRRQRRRAGSRRA